MVTTRSHSKDSSSSSAKKCKSKRKSSETKIMIDKEVSTEEETQKQIVGEVMTQNTVEVPNEYENSLLMAENADTRFGLFKQMLFKMIKIGSNNKITTYEKYDNFYNMYKSINFYFRLFDNEFYYKGKSSHISESRFKIGKQMYAKAQEVRNYLIKNNDINTPIGKALNIQVVEFINIWKLNEYQWFPMEWRETTPSS